MKFCTKCGLKEQDNSIIFCKKCGNKLTSTKYFPKTREELDELLDRLRIAQYRVTQFVLGDHLVYN